MEVIVRDNLDHLDEDARDDRTNQWHNDHTANLVCSLEQVASTTPIPVNPSLRLNKCLPIYQGFNQRLSKTQKALASNCYWCGGKYIAERKNRYRVEGDDTLSRFQCSGCRKNPSRHRFQPLTVEVRQRNDARRQWKKKNTASLVGIQANYAITQTQTFT